MADNDEEYDAALIQLDAVPDAGSLVVAKKICVWPSSMTTVKEMWHVMESTLSAPSFDCVRKITEIIEKRNGHCRHSETRSSNP